MRFAKLLPILLFLGLFGLLLMLTFQSTSQQSYQNKLTISYDAEKMINREIADFELPLVGEKGKLMNKAGLQGKIQCVVFFATWCPFCRSEHPGILKLKDKYPDLNFIAVAFKDREKKIKRYLETSGNPYAFIINDEKGDLSKNWGLKGIPAFFLLDENANIRYHKSGGINMEAFDTEVFPIIQKLKSSK